MTDRSDLSGTDLPDASRANDEALRFVGDFLRAKSAKDVNATMRFFSRDTLTYADATLGTVFKGWDAMHDAYTAMMPHWRGGQSYPLTVWGEIVDGNGSAFVHLVDTPDMFGGEARIFASVEVMGGAIVRWVDHWDSRAFSEAQYSGMRPAGAPFPPDFGGQHLPSSADPELVTAVEALRCAAAVEHLTMAATPPPYGPGAELRRVVGGTRGGGYEWRASNGRPGVMGVAIDGKRQVPANHSGLRPSRLSRQCRRVQRLKQPQLRIDCGHH